jgi:Ca2+-transporting ATPase
MLLVLLVVLVGQWIIVTYGGKMFRTTPLPVTTWIYIILVTSPVMIIGELYRFILRHRHP